MKGKLAEIAWAFLKLGTTAFGGPAAHLAMMEAEFVRKRGWLDHQEFVDLIGAANLIPGPSSTEVAILIGRKRGGTAGLLVAGACFILPAVAIVLFVAWLYVQYHRLPGFQAALYGIKPVVVAIVAQAIVTLVRKVVDNWPKRAVFGLVGALSWFRVNELLLLFAPSFLFAGLALRRTKDWRSAKPLLSLLACVAATAALPIAWRYLQGGPGLHATPWALFVYFAEVGSVLYGGGYVLLAFLERDLVTHWQWLTKGQLLDATAVGQFTPGPVFTTATFIGYVEAGPLGAAAATAGIFLPSFFFVAVVGKLLPKLREAPVSAAFLDGVNSAALGLMAVVAVRLGMDALVDWPTAVIGVGSTILLLRTKINPALFILVGGILGGLLGSMR
ncbi:MAG TPA: chromate efflux transporter [Fimbriimonadaceae bacterium]|nr:chromate efflux transporter [Fimbriimonadaceae bacterium]